MSTPRSHGRRRAALSVATLLLAGASPAVRAQTQERPIRIVVGYGPGGTMDLTGRLVAQGLHQQLDVPVIVDNRPGASGTVAAAHVARSPGDGYTFFVTSVPPHGTLPLLYPSLPFNPERDLKPTVSILATQYVLVVHPEVKATSVAQLAALMRKEGTVEFASPGVGTASHLLSEMLGRTIGAPVLHVPYKGSAALLPDLFSGRVRMTIENLAVMIPHIRKGSVRALAVSGLARSDQLPDVPTVREAGFPDLEQLTAFGLFAPATTPDDKIERINQAVNREIAKPEFVSRIAQFGALPLGGTAARLGDFVAAEKVKWTPIIRDLGLKLE